MTISMKILTMFFMMNFSRNCFLKKYFSRSDSIKKLHYEITFFVPWLELVLGQSPCLLQLDGVCGQTEGIR